MAPIDQSPPIACSIVEQSSAQGVQLRGRLMSQEAVQGRYWFRILKTGPSGSSTINQSGAFAASANAETQVGFADFSLEPGADFTVEFRLLVGDQAYRCARSHGDRQ